jgi:acetyl-CoA synthetase
MGKVVDFNMAEANIKWFVDAKVNITKIVLTDTLPKKATKPHHHFEPNDPSEEALHISILNYTNAFVKWRMYCGNKE